MGELRRRPRASAKLKVLHFAAPGQLDIRTGGYLYDKHIIEGLRERGWSVHVHELASGFPFPDAADLASAHACLNQIEENALLVVDGLALGAMPDVASCLSRRVCLVALVHHPLALETGLSAAEVDRLWQSEEAALESAHGVIVTSETTRTSLARRFAFSKRISVVKPGTTRVRGSRDKPGGALELLCVASLTPRKGHRVLFDALAQLHGLPWRLNCVGGEERDPETAADLRARVVELGLSERVRFSGELDPEDLESAYHRADLFVLASFMEGYGMALAEALAYGIPVVATRAGAIPETVPSAAGVLVASGDVGALAGALGRVIGDPAYRESLADGARKAGARLPGWQEAVAEFEQALLDLERTS